MLLTEVGDYTGVRMGEGGDRDVLTDADRQRAAEEPLHEAGYQKMRAAQTDGSTGLGPIEAEAALAKQRGMLEQQAAAAGQQQAIAGSRPAAGYPSTARSERTPGRDSALPGHR
jgi:hypothetical protein